jgi:hypothetical protein
VHGRKLSRSETQISAWELALAKPLKHNSKFVVKSSRLGLARKALVVGFGIAGKKASSASVGGSGTVQASTHALNLFDSDSSASSDETAPPPHTPGAANKRPRKSPPPKDILKPSATKGSFE